jgi:DNA-binding MarR family transcriptional regulator
MPTARPGVVRKKKSSAVVRAEKPSAEGARWTFLTNHSHVMVLLHAMPDLTVREIAQRVGITERAVQRIIQDLADGGYLRRERIGRRNAYEVLADAHLRHPIEKHRRIGELLEMIVGK